MNLSAGMARPFMFAALSQRVHPLKHSLAESKKQRKNLRQPKNSLAGSLVSRGIAVQLYGLRIYSHRHSEHEPSSTLSTISRQYGACCVDPSQPYRVFINSKYSSHSVSKSRPTAQINPRCFIRPWKHTVSSCR